MGCRGPGGGGGDGGGSGRCRGDAVTAQLCIRYRLPVRFWVTRMRASGWWWWWWWWEWWRRRCCWCVSCPALFIFFSRVRKHLIVMMAIQCSGCSYALPFVFSVRVVLTLTLSNDTHNLGGETNKELAVFFALVIRKVYCSNFRCFPPEMRWIYK